MVFYSTLSSSFVVFLTSCDLQRSFAPPISVGVLPRLPPEFNWLQKSEFALSQYYSQRGRNFIKILSTQIANCPNWIPLALSPLCLIHFWSWEISLFSLLALWGNKNWPPSIKVKQIEISQNKMGLKDCKWSSLNAPGTQNPLSHPFLELGKVPLLTISPLG